jgi:hypothetical protein
MNKKEFGQQVLLFISQGVEFSQSKLDLEIADTSGRKHNLIFK